MSDATPMLLLYGLAGLFGAWLVLLISVRTRLIGRHLTTYLAMAESSLMPLGGMPGPWTTLLFIARRRHRNMGDRNLSLLSDASLVVLVSYMGLFLILVFATKGN